MDAKSLDPKLKEAYDRVMGTATTVSHPPTTTTTPVAPAGSPAPHADIQVTTPANTPVTTQHVETPNHAMTTITTGFVAGNEKTESKFRVSTPILIVGAVAILLVYTLIWVMVFQVQIPFITG